MLSLAIVEHVNEFNAGRLHFSVGGIARALVALVLKTIEPAFRWRVIPAIPFAAHRADHAEFGQLALVGLVGVAVFRMR